MNSEMTLRAMVLLASLSCIAFVLRGLGPRATMTSPRRDIPKLEFFASSSSSSEVEQVRSQLQALSRRYLYTLQVRWTEALRPARDGGVAGAQEAATLIEELEQESREFRGTGEEPVLTNGLLVLLAHQKAFGRWLEVYLDLLYRRPTEELVGRLAPEAVKVGRANGSLEAVLEALRHLTRIPLDFEAKRQAQTLLVQFEVCPVAED